MQIAAVVNVAKMIAAVNPDIMHNLHLETKWLTELKILVDIFSCSQAEGFWNLNIPSKCIQEYGFFLANEYFTIGLDVIVLVMPIYISFLTLRDPCHNEFLISGTFASGLMLISVIHFTHFLAIIYMKIEGQKCLQHNVTSREPLY